MTPHLAASPSSFSAAVAGAGAHPTPTRASRVAFRLPCPASRPGTALRQLRAVRQDGGGGVSTADAEQQLSFYDLLGISSEGSLDEVRAAYRRMARRYHPDVSPPDAAVENTRRFIEVQEAYETLSDPSRRATYDRALARGVCRLAFSASSRRAATYEDQEDKSAWKRSWGDQIAELKRRSMGKDSEESLSWGARMRRRRAEASSDDE